MKKQTTILTPTQPARKEWMLIAVIVAMIYRNQSNRSVPTGTLPLNAVKEMLVKLVADVQQLAGKIANLFYNVTGESFISMLHLLAFAGLIVSIVMAVYYNRVK